MSCLLLWIFFPLRNSSISAAFFVLSYCKRPLSLFPLVYLCRTVAKSDPACRAGYLDEGGGKEEASVGVRFFFVVRKKLCADRLRKMKSCQKFQVAEASGFITAFCEQRSHLPQLFSRFLVPTLFSLALGQLCFIFLGAPPGSRMQ